MPFAFPDAPTAGQVHSEFGVDYVYDASGVWNLQSGGAMTDYVLKAGDEMTGRLDFAARPAAAHAIAIKNDLGAYTLKVTGSNGTHAGLMEFFAEDGTTRRGYIGYGDATTLNINAEGTAAWRFDKNVTVNGNVLITGTNTGVTFPGGSRIYDWTDKALRICCDVQPQIANDAGTNQRDIIDTLNGDARYARLAVFDATIASLRTEIENLRAEITALKSQPRGRR